MRVYSASDGAFPGWCGVYRAVFCVMEGAVTLPPDFTLLQVVPELDTGGAEQTTIDVAHAVVRAGGKALVATRGGRMAARLESDGGRLAEMPVQTKNPLVMLGNAARLADLIRRERVSLIHARSRAPAFSALWAAQATGTPFVATYHGVYNARSSLKRWYNAVMTRGDLVIANSDFTRDHVLAEHQIDPNRIVSIPRGVDLERFNPNWVTPERVAALRQAWDVAPDPGRTTFLLAARLTRIKGHGPVIEACARLKAQGRDDFRLLLVGDDQGRTAYRAELEAQIEPGGLSAGRRGHPALHRAGVLRPHGRGAPGHGSAGPGLRAGRHDRDRDSGRNRLAHSPRRRRRLDRRPGPGDRGRSRPPGRHGRDRRQPGAPALFGGRHVRRHP